MPIMSLKDPRLNKKSGPNLMQDYFNNPGLFDPNNPPPGMAPPTHLTREQQINMMSKGVGLKPPIVTSTVQGNGPANYGYTTKVSGGAGFGGGGFNNSKGTAGIGTQLAPGSVGRGTAIASTPKNYGEILTEDFQKAQDEAKLANETRYADILKGYGSLQNSVTGQLQGRLDTSMNMLKDMGNQEAADISTRWNSEAGKGTQGLIDQGFYGTTVLPTMRAGYGMLKEADLSRMNERLQNQRVSTYGQMSGDVANATSNLGSNRLGFMERRNDTYPDMGMYADLMQKYGLANAYGQTTNANTYGGNSGPGVVTGGGWTHIGGSKTSIPMTRPSPMPVLKPPGVRQPFGPLGTVSGGTQPKKPYIPMVDRSNIKTGNKW